MTFTEYAAKEGCQLLHDDLNYIRRMLQRIPKTQHKAVMKRYVAIWVEGRNNCKNPVQAQNEGRRAANRWIGEQ